jgi:hypothetical protein
LSLVQRVKGNKKKGSTKAAVSGEYLKSAEWNALSAEEQVKVIEARKKSKANDDDNKSTSSSKSIKSLSKMLKSLEKSNCKLKKSVSALQKFKEENRTEQLMKLGSCIILPRRV